MGEPDRMLFIDELVGSHKMRGYPWSCCHTRQAYDPFWKYPFTFPFIGKFTQLCWKQLQNNFTNFIIHSLILVYNLIIPTQYCWSLGQRCVQTLIYVYWSQSKHKILGDSIMVRYVIQYRVEKTFILLLWLCPVEAGFRCQPILASVLVYLHGWLLCAGTFHLRKNIPMGSISCFIWKPLLLSSTAPSHFKQTHLRALKVTTLDVPCPYCQPPWYMCGL